MNPAGEKPGPGAPLPPAAVGALQRGNKIEAIKIVRTEQKVDLKDAKDAVEAYIASQPALQSSMAAAQKAGKGIALRWLVVLVLLGVMAYHFLA